MTLAEKLLQVAQNEQKVYNAGYNKGFIEGGNGSGGSAQETEEKTVVLDMVSGNQEVNPSPNKVLSKVIITKPSTMIPENIKEGIDIGGVIGTHKGDTGIGGSGELPKLFTPSLTNVGTMITIEDHSNGDFTEKYEIYDSNDSKITETVEKIKNLNGLVGDNTIVYVIAVADNFNNSNASNIVTISNGDFAYGTSTVGSGRSIIGIGTVAAENIIIPSSYQGEAVTDIAFGAFKNNTNIKSVYIPDSVIRVLNTSFQYCSNLETVRLSKSITQLFTFSFLGTAIKEIELHEGLKQMDRGCLGETPLISLKIPSTVTKIVGSAWSACTSLEYVDLTSFVGSTPFPEMDSESWNGAGMNTEKGYTEILVPIGRKAELSSMTNWSSHADQIVEVNNVTPT